MEGTPLSRKLPSLACGVGMLAAAASSASPESCRFPGAGRCAAPGQAAVVDWREATSDRDHELWLRVAGKAPVLLAEFGRSAEVLWSPDGSALAITDRAGSSDSAVWVIHVATPSQRQDVEAAFNRAFGKPAEVYRHGHRYFQALSWTSARSLSFEVRAHDAAPEDAYRAEFTYDLEGTVRRHGR